MAEVRLETDLAHPPERVWRALTDAKLLGEWFLRADAAPRLGGELTFRPDGMPGFSGPVSVEVTEFAAPRRLVMRWHGERLDTKVVWEVTETPRGCRVRVVQWGFLGAPVTPRQRNLRAAYTRQFTERLPALLERMAAGYPDPTGDADRAGEADLVADLAPVAELAPVADLAPVAGAAAGASRRPRVQLAEWRRAAPVWVRAALLAMAVAVVVAVVLIGLTGTWPARPEPANPGGRQAPAGAAPPVPAGPAPATPSPPPGTQVPAGPEGGPSAGPAGDLAPAAATPGPAATAAEARPEPATSAAGPAGAGAGADGPELTAEMTTSGRLLGLSGRSVTVTVSNPGPGDAETWTVTMDVGDQQVTRVSGADYTQDGSIVTFTPSGPLPAGESVEFSFDLPGPVLGLGGASDPTGCTIDDRPCG